MPKSKNTDLVAAELDLAALEEGLAALETLETTELAPVAAAAPSWTDKVAAMQIEEEAPKAQAPAPVVAQAPTYVEPVMEEVPGVLADLVAAVSDEDANLMSVEIAREFDDRLAYERTKNPDNASIVKNLTSYRSRLALLSTARFLKAIAFDTGTINRSISEGSRFNVYSLDKVADLAAIFTSKQGRNAINNAITRSLFKFRKAGVPFTGLMAIAAASDKVKVDATLSRLLVRHTVSASTAPTQSSSTMNALRALGVVVNTGNQKFPVWTLTDTPQTRYLEELLAA